jgi:transposase InsO family protein
MSKPQVIVLSVVVQGLSKAEAARRYGVSWQWVHTLVTRYQAGGLEALESRSRRPASNARATPHDLRERIVALRKQLDADGLDAGPVTIATHLTNAGLTAPSTSTIRRILHEAGLVVPDPSKRPRSCLHRFAADQPNECWQSDFTHWHLSDGADVEIIDWLDDHSRLLLSLTVFTRVTGHDVVNTFTDNINTYGPPASTLTDNGSVYTSRFTGGRNAFEYLLAALRIQQKNGHPGHPQTQGKIDRFRHLYNEQRPHRALDGRTPATAYHATLKAAPAGLNPVNEHFRLRLDRVDNGGKISLRRAGRMHHLGVGYARRGQPAIILIDATTATVIHRDTGEVLSTHNIDPSRVYWRDQSKDPGRWPGSQR